MATPFLETLSLRARTAYPIIVSGVRQGLSANSIGRQLSKYQLGLRRSTLLELVAKERAIWEHGQALRFLPRGARPDPSRLPESLTPLRRRYAFTVQIGETRGPEGLLTPRFITISTDTVLTREKLEQLAEDVAEKDSEKYGVEVSKIQLMGGLRASETL